MKRVRGINKSIAITMNANHSIVSGEYLCINVFVNVTKKGTKDSVVNIEYV